MALSKGYFTDNLGNNATFEVSRGEKYDADEMYDKHEQVFKPVPKFFSHTPQSYRFKMKGESKDINAIAPMFHKHVGFGGNDFSIEITEKAYHNFVNNVLGKPVHRWQINPIDRVGINTDMLIISGKWTTEDDPLGASAVGGKRNTKRRSHKKQRSHKKKTHRRRRHH